MIEPLKDNERLYTVTYENLEQLLFRKKYIRNLLQTYLIESNSNEYVDRDYISITKDNCLLNFVVVIKD